MSCNTYHHRLNVARAGKIRQRILSRVRQAIDEARDDLPKLVAKSRNCLKCGQAFFSEFSGNRICSCCKQQHLEE